jgi:hypothetical protein
MILLLLCWIIHKTNKNNNLDKAIKIKMNIKLYNKNNLIIINRQKLNKKTIYRQIII